MIHLINDLCGYRLLLIRLSAATLALSRSLFSALHRAWQDRVPRSFFSPLSLPLSSELLSGSESSANGGAPNGTPNWFNFSVRAPNLTLVYCAPPYLLSLFHQLSLPDLPLGSLSHSINKRVIIAPVKGMVMRAVVMVIGGGGCVFITDLSYGGEEAVIEAWLRRIRTPPPPDRGGHQGNWTKTPRRRQRLKFWMKISVKCVCSSVKQIFFIVSGLFHANVNLLRRTKSCSLQRSLFKFFKHRFP